MNDSGTLRLAIGVSCAACALLLVPAAPAADPPAAPRKLWQQYPLKQAPAKAGRQARALPAGRPRAKARHEPVVRKPATVKRVETRPASQAPARRQPVGRVDFAPRPEARAAVSATGDRDSAPLVPIALGAALVLLLAGASFVLLHPAVGFARVPRSAAALLGAGSSSQRLPERRRVPRAPRAPRLGAALEVAADSGDTLRRLRYRARRRLRSVSLYAVGLAFVTLIAYMISRIP